MPAKNNLPKLTKTGHEFTTSDFDFGLLAILAASETPDENVNMYITWEIAC
jgi:hypothetical protein